MNRTNRQTWRGLLALRLALAAGWASGLAACEEESLCDEGELLLEGECVVAMRCGAGTVADGTECVVDEAALLRCGAGTEPRDGDCVPAASACAPGTVLQGEGCAPDPASCPEGSWQDGVCVAPAGPTCAPGTTLEDGRCVVAEGACAPGTTLTDGGCAPLLTACGAGTAERDGRCELDAAACAPGATLTEGACAPDITACGAGTILADGVCVGQGASCGAGTVEIDGRCELDASACGAGTALADGVCLPVASLACGGGTEQQGDLCVGTLSCGEGTVEAVDALGAPICLDPVLEELSVQTWAERIARTYCEGIFRCCDPHPAMEPAILPAPFVIDQVGCERGLAFWLDSEVGLSIARRAREEGVEIVEDLAYMADIEGVFDPGDTCTLDLSPRFVELLRTDGAPLLFTSSVATELGCGNEANCPAGQICADPERVCHIPWPEGTPCSNSRSCADGLGCLFGQCAPTLAAGEPCYEDELCADGLSCFIDADQSGVRICASVANPGPSLRCDTAEDCPEGAFCDLDAGTCQPELALGSPCNPRFGRESCAPGALCAPDEAGVFTCQTTAWLCAFPIFGDGPEGRR